MPLPATAKWARPFSEEEFEDIATAALRIPWVPTSPADGTLAARLRNRVMSNFSLDGPGGGPR